VPVLRSCESTMTLTSEFATAADYLELQSHLNNLNSYVVVLVRLKQFSDDIAAQTGVSS